jgi:LuxR family transcriptional regulator, quorum-sensing system regulator BjaR1
MLEIGPLEIALNFIDQVEKLDDIDRVMTAAKDAVSLVGLSSILIADLPIGGHSMSPLVSCWPKEWLERYSSKGYLGIDPVAQCAFNTSLPFLWGAAPVWMSVKASKAMMSEAADFGLVDGLCIPMHTAVGAHSVVSFSSKQPLELSRRDLAMAHMIGVSAYERVRGLAVQKQDIRGRLTSREREILTWTAAGKSAWEASSILHVSEATVIAHLNNARRKLNVATTTHAVALALRRGEIGLI